MVPQQFRKEADARIRIFRHHSFSNRSDFRNDYRSRKALVSVQWCTTASCYRIAIFLYSPYNDDDWEDDEDKAEKGEY